ncbi:hypothetical protein IMZ48_12190 [Candidatus Bathyarchaeota archaeon]|nr:hypothetical protein [Candidatus Bathyarchaeota archaeon]
MILDAGGDMNIYLESLPDGGKKTEGGGGDGQSCCGPEVAVETPACSSGPKKEDAGGHSLTSMAADLGDMNLNEWIGMRSNPPLVFPCIR